MDNSKGKNGKDTSKCVGISGASESGKHDQDGDDFPVIG